MFGKGDSVHANKFLLSSTIILVISMLACSLQSGTPAAPKEAAATNTGVDLSEAVAGTLTALATHATPSSTETPSMTFTPVTPTATPSDTPTQTPTKTSTHTPTRTFTPTWTATSGNKLINPHLLKPIHPILPLSPVHLDYTANANYGEANLGAGFTPDPYPVGMTSGGKVGVAYLGASCTGFASVAPDLRLNFGGGGASLLRIYFIGGNGDAAMVVNDPFGNFYCVDDSFGTVNPTMDFNNPAGGTYDVWIGSSVSGTTIAGTLYVTSNAGNHP
jgi:hypothetical protein